MITYRMTLRSEETGGIWLLDQDGKPYHLVVEGEDLYEAISKLADYEDLAEQHYRGMLRELQEQLINAGINTRTLFQEKQMDAQSD